MIAAHFFYSIPNPLQFSLNQKKKKNLKYEYLYFIFKLRKQMSEENCFKQGLHETKKKHMDRYNTKNICFNYRIYIIK